jgi:hypothetical protein
MARYSGEQQFNDLVSPVPFTHHPLIVGRLPPLYAIGCTNVTFLPPPVPSQLDADFPTPALHQHGHNPLEPGPDVCFVPLHTREQALATDPSPDGRSVERLG